MLLIPALAVGTGVGIVGLIVIVVIVILISGFSDHKAPGHCGALGKDAC
jgi:Sec-independent protein translocase protein TatA